MNSKATPHYQLNAKAQLLHEDYFNLLRSSDFSTLDKDNDLYFDYTGANLPAKRLLEQHFKLLYEHIQGNPHSQNPTSNFSTKILKETREAVLDFFNAKGRFDCIFCYNASAAIQMVAEYYSFGIDGQFLLTTDNHNSIQGIRRCCKNYKYVGIDSKTLEIDQFQLETDLKSAPVGVNKLFAYPAQSNSSGVKHPLDLIKKAKDHGWDVLLDAAAFVPTSRLDLSQYNPDFVPISFYKMFGYPTGLGCLLVSKDKLHLLDKKWFAGGNVEWVSIDPPDHQWSEGHKKFENGTPSFGEIPAIQNGLNFLNDIGHERISQRISSLANYCIDNMLRCKHDNKQPLVKVFGSGVCANRSGTISIDILDETGNPIPFKLVELLAAQAKISIRAGKFCNYGVFETNNPNYKISKRPSGCGEHNELQVASGTIRVSVGIATIKQDIDKLITFINTLKNENHRTINT